MMTTPIAIDPSITQFAQTFGVMALLLLLFIPVMGTSLVMMGRVLWKQTNTHAEVMRSTAQAMTALADRMARVESSHSTRLDKLDTDMVGLAARVDRLPTDVRHEIEPVFATLNNALDLIERRQEGQRIAPPPRIPSGPLSWLRRIGGVV